MHEKMKMRGTDDIARKWRALAERRREHLAYLHHSGRWRRYYREDDFLTQMHATSRMADAWSVVGN